MKKFSVLFLILALAMVMAGSAKANYLLNPGFEDPCTGDSNVPEHWEFFVHDPEETGKGTITYNHAVAHAGADSVEMEIETGGTDVVLSCFQEICAAEGIPYKLTAYVNTYWGSKGSIKLEFKNENGDLIREDVNEIDYSTDNGWMLLTVDSNGVAPIGTRTVTATVFNDTINANQTYYDDLDLTHTKGEALTNCETSQFSADFAGISAGDVNRDCLVDLRDIAALAEYWVRCNAVGCPDCGYGGWDCSGL